MALRAGRMTLTVPFALCVATIVFLVGVSGQDYKLNEHMKSKAELNGSRWFRIGPALLYGAKLVTLSENDGGGKAIVYKIEEPENISAVNKWLKDNIEPFLNMHPKDGGRYAEEFQYALELYLTGDEAESSLILSVPLSLTKDPFRKSDFDALVTKFKAVKKTE